MMDANKRLDRVETRLGNVETRLGNVETRLGNVETRLGGVETRLGGVENHVKDLRGDVNTLTGRVETQNTELQKLRVLVEDQADRIKLVAEVQAHQGTALDRLVKDIEPLKGLPELIQSVLQNYGRRITALEGRAGQ